MATVTNKLYGNFFLNACMKTVTDISAVGTAIKVCLLLNTYTFNQGTHTSYNDISTYETTGDGYSAGGATLANKALTYSNRVTTFDADDVSWTASTITARYAVVYDAAPASATDKKLICIIDFGEDKSSSGTTFSIVWSASGIFTVTVAA